MAELKIRTGFLVGNLFNDETGIDIDSSARAYARALREEILSEYPGAEVEVIWQNATGTKPYSLRTRVQRGDMTEETSLELERIAEHIDWIASLVWHDWDCWVVYLNQEGAS